MRHGTASPSAASVPARASAPGAAAVRSYLHTLEAQFPKKKPMQITPRLRFYLENKRVIDEAIQEGA